jgi:hypothetical protein
MDKLCNAPTSKFLVACGNKGQARYGGKCHIHREPTPEERAVARVKAVAARKAEFAEMEHHLDLAEARGGFLRQALARGLAAPETVQEFERFKKLSEKG